MRAALIGIVLMLATPAAADHAPANPQSLSYKDDRSTPQEVVESYYNAINRNEYARAYSYFGQNDAPADFDKWEFGYSDTYWVDVHFGEIVVEGAAGSTYYSLPVHLTVERTEGQHAYFSGCYVLRLAQPAIQGVPFQPMHIVNARLDPANADATSFPDCTNATVDSAALR
jgi:hypothetical protein